jgi:hypothetical protein
MKICYVSDFFLSDLIGGGELNDHELCSILSKQVKINKIRCRELTINKVQQYTHFIISNFISLSPYVKDYITKNCNYVIYEHDHKYLKNRNPSVFKDFRAPSEAIINESFYRSAKAVFCQSSFHENIISLNLDNVTLVNVSGNLWSTDSLSIMKTLCNKEKREWFSILNSKTEHKNTSGSLLYCDAKNYKSELISSQNYQEFLSLLSNNNSFVFLPKTPETLSRVVVECRMMNMRTVINKNVGASYEPWFQMKGNELIDFMESKRRLIPDLVIRELQK